ncbi:MAG: cytochrome c-550 PedF [Proteobacteria bacterium]|nr:cytochrome c-550 PedF [Pseudomonadota bacterium]
MRTKLYLTVAGLTLALGVNLAWSHGDVTPQAVNTDKLEQLGEERLDVSPYRGNTDAIAIGKGAYSQNCARCHGLGGVSGGVAPDLRELGTSAESDEWFIYRATEGSVRNGMTYMPAMGEFLSQEALWTISAWLDTVTVADD